MKRDHVAVVSTDPADALSNTMTRRRDGDVPFVASLVAMRRPATAHELRASLRSPWAPLPTTALIRWQGMRLGLGGLEVQPR